MNQPKQPADHPAAETPADPHGQAPNGVPNGAGAAEPTGTPHADRAKTENAAKD